MKIARTYRPEPSFNRGDAKTHVQPNACYLEYGWLDYATWYGKSGHRSKRTFYFKDKWGISIGVITWQTYQYHLFD